MNTLTGFFRVLLTPTCWLQNNDFCPEWDSVLNDAMARFKFKKISPYRATLGPYQVWISNHPYASFSPLTPCDPWIRDWNARPRRITILRAHDKLRADTRNQLLKKHFQC